MHTWGPTIWATELVAAAIASNSTKYRCLSGYGEWELLVGSKALQLAATGL